MAFPSVYEMTNPLTTVRKQHFWEYFSGADITQATETVYTQGSGAGWTGAVPLSGAGNTRTGIRVEAGSSAIGKVVRKVTGKLSKSNSPTGTYKWTIRNNADTIVAETPTGNSSLLATAASVTETEFTFDVSRTLVEGDRIQVEFSGGDASNDINLSYNNALPSMPSGFKRCLYGGSYSDTTTGTPYLIVDSSPATSVLPPTRWTFTEINSTATGAMTDEVDGGYAISTTASADRGSLSFNDIRPFSFNSSVLISTMKRTGSTGEVCITGFVEDKSNSNSGSYDHAIIRDREADTYKKAFTGNGTTSGGTDTTFAVNADWTTYKIELTSSNAYFYVNGAIGATRTGTAEYLPLTKLQPMFWGEAGSGGSGKASIKYMECYNT